MSSPVDKKKFLLRLSPRVWEELQRWADDEFRSVNGQIEYVLQRALSEHRKSKHDQER